MRGMIVAKAMWSEDALRDASYTGLGKWWPCFYPIPIISRLLCLILSVLEKNNDKLKGVQAGNQGGEKELEIMTYVDELKELGMF